MFEKATVPCTPFFMLVLNLLGILLHVSFVGGGKTYCHNAVSVPWRHPLSSQKNTSKDTLIITLARLMDFLTHSAPISNSFQSKRWRSIFMVQIHVKQNTIKCLCGSGKWFTISSLCCRSLHEEETVKENISCKHQSTFAENTFPRQLLV